jgi:hypothetical protein
MGGTGVTPRVAQCVMHPSTRDAKHVTCSLLAAAWWHTVFVLMLGYLVYYCCSAAPQPADGWAQTVVAAGHRTGWSACDVLVDFAAVVCVVADAGSLNHDLALQNEQAGCRMSGCDPQQHQGSTPSSHVWCVLAGAVVWCRLVAGGTRV